MRPHVLHWLTHRLGGDLASLLAPSWFTCVGLAGVAGLILMLVLARRRGIDPGAVASIVLWCYIAAVFAGIFVPALIDGVDRFVATGRFQLRWSGMTSFWGYLAGALAFAAVCQNRGLPLARIADLSVIPLGVALVFARLGCFMAGCDYGKISSLPWAVRFPAGSPAWRDHLHSGLIGADRTASLPVHPTELYEALLGLVIVGAAIAFVRRKRKDGDAFLLAAAIYALGRLAIETLRGDLGRGIYAGLSSGQIFSLLVLLAIAARIVVDRRRVLAVAATGFALLVAHPGAAHAQPIDAPPPVADPHERPLFSLGAMAGVAMPLNRRANQVASLDGGSLSIGYMPGYFGFWIDLDTLANREASHSTGLAALSYTRRPTRSLMLGARAGFGVTLVNFHDAAFRDVTSATYRFDMIAEYAFVRHWALWVRPLTIDMLSASGLGGPITTYQFRLGVAYRFGSRSNAPRPPDASQLPALPPEPPPLPPLALGGEP